MTRRALVLALLPAISLSALADAGDVSVTLSDPQEVLKLPSDAVPPLLTNRPFARFSPDGTRVRYVRMHGPGKAKVHCMTVGRPESDDPVPWGEGIPSIYCLRDLCGYVWRADGQRMLLLHPRLGDDGKPGPGWEKALTPWAMCWDVKNPQWKSQQYLQVKGAQSCTATSFGPKGLRLYTAVSDLADGKLAAVTCWDSAKKRSRTLYRVDRAAIYFLAPSPDGRLLAWLEFPARLEPPAQRTGPKVVVLDLKAGKVVRRIQMSSSIPNWPDAFSPVWVGGSEAICYGDVARVMKMYRREVRLQSIQDGESRLLVRDAVAIGAIGSGVIVNRGPQCQPMAQTISSDAPTGAAQADLPTVDNVLFVPLREGAEPAVLMPGAFAEQVQGEHLYYRVQAEPQTLVMRAKLKTTSPGGARGPAKKL